MSKVGQGDNDHNDVYDTFTKFQQQLDEQAALLRTLSATLNEVRLNQEPQYRDPIKEDMDNQPPAHRCGPRRVPRTDSDFHDRNNSNSDFKSSKSPFVTNKSSLSNGSKQSDWKKGAPVKTQTPSKQPNLRDSSVKRTREIECFKSKGRGHYSRECPNTRLLLLKDNGKYTSDSDKTDPDMPELVDDSDNGEELVEPPKEGDFADFQCLSSPNP
ncbi:hypothetical protein GOBAR_DD19013 [Gossypium barbadense]|nr:hypothetical protein GOBAR_DD19013 [Gossypium barbadense]